MSPRTVSAEQGVDAESQLGRGLPRHPLDKAILHPLVYQKCSLQSGPQSGGLKCSEDAPCA
jgi:hypothetical protein